MNLADLLTAAGGLWGGATLLAVAWCVYVCTRDEPADEGEVIYVDFRREDTAA